MNLSELLKNISIDTFSDVVSHSPRKVRESLYSHYGIKSKNRFSIKSIKSKKEERVSLLLKMLQGATNLKEKELLNELFRNWLFYQRPLLKETLDFLGVENDNGLIDTEPDFFKELSEKKVSDLVAHLSPKFPKDSILIYFCFMEVPHIKKYCDLA